MVFVTFVECSAMSVHVWVGESGRRPVVVKAVILGLLATGMTSGAAEARKVAATGTLKPTATITLSANASGAIQDLSCDVNAAVKKGQTCAQIDPRPYQRAIDANRAELASAVAQFEQHMASFNQAKAAYDRNAGLLERGLVTKASFEGVESNYKQSQAQIAYHRAVIEQRKVNVATAELNLSYTRVTSPIDGLVLERRISTGETASGGSGLFVIASDLTKMHAIVRIDETDIAAFRSADNASLSVKAFPNQKFTGKVKQVRYVPEAAGSTVSYEVVIEVDNIELYLRPGMSVAAEVEVTG
jgi:HlyD family secretion protein